MVNDVFMLKCSILCNIDGNIISFDEGTCSFFGYKNPDLLRDNRIFNLFYKDSVIDFIDKFNSFFFKSIIKNNLNSEYTFLCLQSTGSVLLVTVTFEKKDSFLLVTFKKNDKNDKNDKKNINIIYKWSFFKKLNIIIRGKFLIGSLIPFVFSVFYSIGKFDSYSYFMIFIIAVGLFFFHVAANTFNDYFDWTSGRDKLNKGYVLFSTGGSRAIDFNFVTEKGMLFISVISFIIVAFIGLYVTYIRGIIVLFIGLFTVFSVYFYSAPPIHFASRYGLGELLHIVCLGPLVMGGCVLAITGDVYLKDFLIGFPFGFLITSCLLINEYPDSKFDLLSGKINLAVILGEKYISYLFFILCFLSYFIILFCVEVGYLSKFYIFVFFTVFYFIRSFKYILNIGTDRTFVIESCRISLNIYLFFSFSLLISRVLELIF